MSKQCAVLLWTFHWNKPEVSISNSDLLFQGFESSGQQCLDKSWDLFFASLIENLCRPTLSLLFLHSGITALCFGNSMLKLQGQVCLLLVFVFGARADTKGTYLAMWINFWNPGSGFRIPMGKSAYFIKFQFFFCSNGEADKYWTDWAEVFTSDR